MRCWSSSNAGEEVIERLVGRLVGDDGGVHRSFAALDQQDRLEEIRGDGDAAGADRRQSPLLRTGAIIHDNIPGRAALRDVARERRVTGDNKGEVLHVGGTGHRRSGSGTARRPAAGIVGVRKSITRESSGPKKPFKSIKGLWADLGVSLSAEEIDEARREMWKNFPREDI